MKITVNRANWTGKLGTITINEDGETFSIEDLEGTFKLSKKTLEDEDGELGDIFYVTTPDGWEFKGYGFTTLNRPYTVIFEDCGVSRENQNPFIAFATLAWNLY